MAVAVSGIGIRTRCFQTWVQDHDGTRCTSVIVLKLIGNSIKGKKNNFHLKFIFSVESMLAILSIHCSFLHYERIDTMGLPYVMRHPLFPHCRLSRCIPLGCSQTWFLLKKKMATYFKHLTQPYQNQLFYRPASMRSARKKLYLRPQ